MNLFVYSAFQIRCRFRSFHQPDAESPKIGRVAHEVSGIHELLGSFLPDNPVCFLLLTIGSTFAFSRCRRKRVLFVLRQKLKEESEDHETGRRRGDQGQS